MIANETLGYFIARIQMFLIMVSEILDHLKLLMTVTRWSTTS